MTGPTEHGEYPRPIVDTQAPGTVAPPVEDEPGAGQPGEAPPPVVAVVVTHDPGPWFEESLRSLRDQTYRALSVLVIDAGSAVDPTPRIAAVLPSAYVRRLDANPGFGAVANEVLGVVEGAAFHLICHDDVALDPDAVRALVEEAFRSNAGIAGPKLVAWSSPAELRQVGASVDKTGVMVPFAEPGELDQEQHDAVRDVFVVPGGATLVRADLFEALGGFDPGIDYLGEDLDLCWRAHVAGARVLVVPSARVRHLEALGQRRGADDRRRLQARHRVRTLLSCYRPLHLARVVPQALFFTVVEALYGLLSGHVDHARDVVGAWTWNLRRLGEIRAKRKAIGRTRTVGDSEVRELQVRGSARLTAFLRGQLGGTDDRLAVMSRTGRQLAGGLRPRSGRAVLVTGAVVVLLVALGTRNLVLRPIPAVGELAAFPDSPTALWRGWTSGWWPAGLGSTAPAPTGLGLLGGAGWLMAGATGLLRKVLILGLLPVGALGAWRLARPLGSLRSAVAALVVYAAIPVPYNALARGGWGGLALYAAAPWLLLQLARASQLAPFGRADLVADSPEAAAAPPSRPVRRQVLSTGLLLAFVGAFVPFVVPVAGLVAVALVVGSLFCGRTRGSGRVLVVVAGGALLAAVLHLPWSLDLVGPGSGWSAFVGPGAGEGGASTVGHLLRFQTGPFGATPLGWAFLLTAALPVVIGRGWRLEWAVRAWFVALAGWGLLWVGQEGWLPFALPPAEVLLAPVAAALAFAAALGMAAFEVDLPGYRFGWRQALSTVAAAAVVVGILPLVPGVIDGRWRVPGGDLRRPLAAVLASDGRVPSRVLWVGDPEVLPVAGWRLDDRLTYGTSEGIPSVRQRWAGSPEGATGLLADALRLAADRRTSRLGALLAPMGVRYVVVPERNTPTAFAGELRPAPASLTTTLSEQLDLTQVESDPALTVYRNTAWRGMVTTLPPTSGRRDRFTDALDVDPAATRPALEDHPDPTTWTGRIDRTGEVLLSAAAAPGWHLEVDGVEARRSRAYGWANRFDVGRAGPARLEFRTPPWRWVACALQALAWLLAVVLLWRTSPTRHASRRLRRAVARGETLEEPA